MQVIDKNKSQHITRMVLTEQFCIFGKLLMGVHWWEIHYK